MIRRKNRVQSLKQSQPGGQKEQIPTSTILDGDSMEGGKPYLLLQKASNTDLNTIYHRSSTSVRSCELLTRTNTGDSPRCPSFLAAKTSNDVDVDKCITKDCENCVECWMPSSIKCWTPVEIQTQVMSNNTLTMYDMETGYSTTNDYLTTRECSTRIGCHTPWECPTQKECFTPRECLTSREYLIPRKSPLPKEYCRQNCSTPSYLQTSDQYRWGKTDNLKNDNPLSRIHVKPENFQTDRSQMFISNHNSQFDIEHHPLQSTELCTPKLFLTGNTRILSEKAADKEERNSSGISLGNQSFSEETSKNYPAILLTESNICGNVSNERDLSPSLINRNIYDRIMLSYANATSCSWTNIRENHNRSQLLTPYWSMGNPGSSTELKLLSSQQTSIVDRPKSDRLLVSNTLSHFK